MADWEVLHASARTRVTRTPGTPGLIYKAPIGPDAAQRRANELKMLARLHGIAGVVQLAPGEHPSTIVALTDCGGRPLLQRLRGGAIDPPALCVLGLELARIVAAIHRAGVLHRDIHPGHILLTGQADRPVLIDFQLATAFSEGEPGFTHHREIQGRLAYLAPEQTGRTGRMVDQRSDLYALGVTLYELATGQLPYDDADPLQLIRDHLLRQPVPPGELQPALPQALSAIIVRLLEKEPDRRYQGAQGLAHDLERLHRALENGDPGLFPLGERDFAERLKPPSRLLGRVAELRVVKQAFADAMQGRGRVLFVSGAAGVGKTSLTNELRPMVAAQRGWFVSGKFDQYRHDAPSATIQALRALGRLLLAEPQAELARHRERILRSLGGNAGLITAVGREYALLLGPQPQPPPLEPAQAEARSLLNIMDLLRAVVSPERPLVVALDDVQWAHPVSVRFIETVITAPRFAGLLLVCALRDGELPETHPLSAALQRWAQLEQAPVMLRLSNLPVEDLGLLLAEMLRMPAAHAARLAGAIEPHTGGNPYHTMELVNALRHDGILVPGPQGWQWAEPAVRRYIGQGNVLDLLRARIGRLPPPARAALLAVACLGGEVSLGRLQAALGLSAAQLEEHLAAPLEDGLLVLNPGDELSVRTRHDRVQQAAYAALDEGARRAMHLSIARRLAVCPALAGLAASQYFAAIDELRDIAERGRVARLLRLAAAEIRLLYNYVTVERYITAAVDLLRMSDAPEDAGLLAQIEVEQHAAFYSLGRLEEADAVYQAIERRATDVLQLIEPACVQVTSLTNRRRNREAVDLGLALLRRLGVPVPQDLGADVSARLDGFCIWVEQEALEDDTRAGDEDPRIALTAKLITRLVAPALFSDQMAAAWLAMESQRLWAAHGPSAAVVGLVSAAPFAMISLRQAYLPAYKAVSRVVAIGRKNRLEPETWQALLRFALYTSHWFDPLEQSIGRVQEARQGLLRCGELQMSCLTYFPNIVALLDCGPTLDSCAGEIEAGLAFSDRTGNDFARISFIPYRQLVRALRGETQAPGSLFDADFTEQDHARICASAPTSAANAEFLSALCRALFSDLPAMARHVETALPFLPFQHSMYPVALWRVLHAISLAEQLRALGPGAPRAQLLAQLDDRRDWLAERAADCPANFSHLLYLVEAERALSLQDPWAAALAFDAALRQGEAGARPWHMAFIAERAGQFHLAHGMQWTGRQLLADARSRYEAWGAHGKVRQLEESHAFLARGHDNATPDAIAVDQVDTLAILRVSQALSSETSLSRLKARVEDLLGSLTGATTVRFALWQEDAGGWFISAEPHDPPVPLEEAGAQGLLPLSPLRYAERTGEPLLLEDATLDDRFSRDPYFAGMPHCSLLVVPILHHGAPRALLVLENTQRQHAFGTAGLDAIMLIAGQLAVSLENASLYEKLDQRVREKTEQLREAQQELLTAARRAGMAEIASNVLHNVGNVLNSVNVSAELMADQLRNSRVSGISRVAQLMAEHESDLSSFLSSDPKGRLVPGYLHELGRALRMEHDAMASELVALRRHVEHIKDVVALQQSYAGSSRLLENVSLPEVIDDALRLNAQLERQGVQVVKQIGDLPPMLLDRHRVMQVLINLIDNAQLATGTTNADDRRITIGAVLEGGRLRITVSDNGEGIQAENLSRVFSHGFTTRKNGHGFGLHSCALAAQEMGGNLSAGSPGPGQGATFTLDLPAPAVQASP